MTNTKILDVHDGCHHRFPLRCQYQRCSEPIRGHPMVRRYYTSANTKTKYYHVECARVLRLI